MKLPVAEATKSSDKAIVRNLQILPRKGELFIQPKDFSPEREVIENHHRQIFANHFNFADPWLNPRNYDPKGKYNCQDCNQIQNTFCALLAILKVAKIGSCEDWENQCAGDTEMKLREKSILAANYGEPQNGVGYGCNRCPYSSAALQPDSMGRTRYCGKGDFRILGTECCQLNGAKNTKKDYMDLSLQDNS